MRLPTEYSDMAAALTRYDVHHAIPHRLGRSERPDRPCLFFCMPSDSPTDQAASLFMLKGRYCCHSLTEKVKKKEKGLLDLPPRPSAPLARDSPSSVPTYLAISQPGNQTSMIHDEDDDDDCSETIH